MPILVHMLRATHFLTRLAIGLVLNILLTEGVAALVIWFLILLQRPVQLQGVPWAEILALVVVLILSQITWIIPTTAVCSLFQVGKALEW